ncbi:anhydro-N-acetylmuramic acid kinase [Marinimicrococcus flavescens]|uniref:Anhydro-N-acetylmuramic acid kinase n=1 Tax=Marinimicrococcus flavescens TaxID=3031815 RepID=A0AAP3UYV3_9PROT|nr:anhydro-N-acetylmuramic acid kinase [Marinimicrococcus flavescens]
MSATRLEQVRSLPTRLVAGLMTGTSMDGLDMALCRVEAGRPWAFELVATDEAPMPAALRAGLAAQGAMSLGEAARLDRALGLWFADALAPLAERAGQPLDLIGSHGQTAYHEHGVTTVQLGEPAFLAVRFGCPVVSDFRRNDIALGGCGAPLVPAIDRWLFGRPDAGVVALNIGGIANLTAIPPEGPVTGFDCGPGNMVLDALARRFTGGRQAADLGGVFAARGRVRPEWLAPLLAEPFFALQPPRSAGREEFGEAFVEALLARAAPADEAAWHDLFATALELTVQAIAGSLQSHVAFRPASLIASGGGARNPRLMARLAEVVAPVMLTTSDALGVPGDHKEAITFALLASARLDGLPGNLPEVTGATRPVLLGKITEC